MSGNGHFSEERKAQAIETVLSRIASTSDGLDKICENDAALPSGQTFRKWLADDTDLVANYARAREAQADRLAQQILEIADAPVATYDSDEDGEGANRLAEAASRSDMERRRQQIDARKWAAGKLAPRVYGDRLQVDAEVGVKLTDEQLNNRVSQLLRKAGITAAPGGTGSAEGEA